MRTDHHHHHHFACSDPRLSTLACPSTSKPLLSVMTETVDSLLTSRQHVGYEREGGRMIGSLLVVHELVRKPSLDEIAAV